MPEETMLPSRVHLWSKMNITDENSVKELKEKLQAGYSAIRKSSLSRQEKSRLLGPMLVQQDIDYSRDESISSVAKAILTKILKEKNEEAQKREELAEDVILAFIIARIKLDLLHESITPPQKKNDQEQLDQTGENLAWLDDKTIDHIAWLEQKKRIGTIKEQSKIDSDIGKDGVSQSTVTAGIGSLKEEPGRVVSVKLSDNSTPVYVGISGENKPFCRFGKFDKDSIETTIHVLSSYDKILWNGVRDEDTQRNIEIACAKAGKRATFSGGRESTLLMQAMPDGYPKDLAGWAKNIFEQYSEKESLAKGSMINLVQHVIGLDEDRLLDLWEGIDELTLEMFKSGVREEDGPGALGVSEGEENAKNDEEVQAKKEAFKQAVEAAMSDEQRKIIANVKNIERPDKVEQPEVAANVQPASANAAVQPEGESLQTVQKTEAETQTGSDVISVSTGTQADKGEKSDAGIQAKVESTGSAVQTDNKETLDQGIQTTQTAQKTETGTQTENTQETKETETDKLVTQDQAIQADLDSTQKTLLELNNLLFTAQQKQTNLAEKLKTLENIYNRFQQRLDEIKKSLREEETPEASKQTSNLRIVAEQELTNFQTQQKDVAKGLESTQTSIDDLRTQLTNQQEQSLSQGSGIKEAIEKVNESLEDIGKRLTALEKDMLQEEKGEHAKLETQKAEATERKGTISQYWQEMLGFFAKAHTDLKQVMATEEKEAKKKAKEEAKQKARDDAKKAAEVDVKRKNEEKKAQQQKDREKVADARKKAEAEAHKKEAEQLKKEDELSQRRGVRVKKNIEERWAKDIQKEQTDKDLGKQKFSALQVEINKISQEATTQQLDGAQKTLYKELEIVKRKIKDINKLLSILPKEGLEPRSTQNKKQQLQEILNAYTKMQSQLQEALLQVKDKIARKIVEDAAKYVRGDVKVDENEEFSKLLEARDNLLVQTANAAIRSVEEKQGKAGVLLQAVQAKQTELNSKLQAATKPEDKESSDLQSISGQNLEQVSKQLKESKTALASLRKGFKTNNEVLQECKEITSGLDKMFKSLEGIQGEQQKVEGQWDGIVLQKEAERKAKEEEAKAEAERKEAEQKASEEAERKAQEEKEALAKVEDAETKEREGTVQEEARVTKEMEHGESSTILRKEEDTELNGILAAMKQSLDGIKAKEAEHKEVEQKASEEAERQAKESTPSQEDDDGDESVPVSELDIDLMFDVLRQENVQAAYDLAQKLKAMQKPDAKELQTLAQVSYLLVEYYRNHPADAESKNLPKATEVHELAQGVLLTHIIEKVEQKNLTSGMTDMELLLTPDYYRLYSLLSKKKADANVLKNRFPGLPIEFLNTTTLASLAGKSIGEMIRQLYQAKHEQNMSIDVPSDERTINTQNALKEFNSVSLGSLKSKDIDDITYKLAYLTVSSNYTIDAFLEKAKELQRQLNEKQQAIRKELESSAVKTALEKQKETERRNQLKACERFFSVYQILLYRERAGLGSQWNSKLDKAKQDCFLRKSDFKETDLHAKLEEFKKYYFSSKYPFSQKGITIGEDKNQGDYKVELKIPSNKQKLSTEFTQQMNECGKPTWRLSVIVKVMQDRGSLPHTFLDKFADSGLCLLRDYVYPALIASQAVKSKMPEGEQAADVNSLLELLPKNATSEQQIQFLQKTMRFMHDNLNGGGIRQTQVTNMLQSMSKVATEDRPGYVISKAGSGKTVMAQFFAECILNNVPAILFISPVREAGVTQLTEANFDAFINLQLKDGKSQKYFITPGDFRTLLDTKLQQLTAESLEKTILALRKIAYVCDEFDSERYVRDNLSLQDIFQKHKINRVINMSATDNLVMLKISLERKLFKLQAIQEEIKQGTCKIKNDGKSDARKAHLKERIENLRKSIAEIELNIQKELQEPKAKTIVDTDATTSEIQCGKCVLLMYPDASYEGVDKLVEQYKPKKDENIAVLYRNAEGKRMAWYQGKEIEFEDFSREFKGLSEDKKPFTYCLYTVDSRGGDFGEFSNGNSTKVLERHVFLEKVKSINELYQILRRLRGTDRTVPVMVHLGTSVIGELSKMGYALTQPFDATTNDNNFNQVKNAAEKQGTLETNAQTITRLNSKLKVKMLRIVNHALQERWKLSIEQALPEKVLPPTTPRKQSTRKPSIPGFTHDNYKVAMTEVLGNYSLDPDRNFAEQYADIQGRVINRFLEIVNDAVVKESAEFKNMERKDKILNGIILEAIWKNKGSATTWGDLWLAYVKDKLGEELTKEAKVKAKLQGVKKMNSNQQTMLAAKEKEIAIQYGEDLGVIVRASMNNKVSGKTEQQLPGVLQQVFLVAGERGTNIEKQRLELQTAMQRMKESQDNIVALKLNLSSEHTQLLELSETTEKEKQYVALCDYDKKKIALMNENNELQSKETVESTLLSSRPPSRPDSPTPSNSSFVSAVSADEILSSSGKSETSSGSTIKPVKVAGTSGPGKPISGGKKKLSVTPGSLPKKPGWTKNKGASGSPPHPIRI